MTMQPDAILETALYAEDLDAAEQFYAGVLGLEMVACEEGRHIFFRCGRGMLLIFHPAHAGSPENGIPHHGTRGPGHLAFRAMPEQLDNWREVLSTAGIAIESELTWPNGARSIYFRDPAGNSLEFATPSLWGL